MTKLPTVYIITNKPQGTLYIGVTSNLTQRIYQHKNKTMKSFSAKYNLDKLVWYEQHSTMEYAINREKQLKSGSREKKILLIEKLNPDWFDLYDTIL